MSKGDTTEETGERVDRLAPESQLTRDDIFHVLQCRRRRLVLKFLQEYDGDGSVPMRDIAEHVAAVEHDTTVDGLASRQRQRVYIALYQDHLPKMDTAGIIDYDQSRGHVAPTAQTVAFYRYLDREPSIVSDRARTDG